MLLIQLLDCEVSVHITMWKKRKKKEKAREKKKEKKEKKKKKKNTEIILQPHLVNKWEYFIVDKEVIF